MMRGPPVGVNRGLGRGPRTEPPRSAGCPHARLRGCPDRQAPSGGLTSDQLVAPGYGRGPQKGSSETAKATASSVSQVSGVRWLNLPQSQKYSLLWVLTKREALCRLTIGPESPPVRSSIFRSNSGHTERRDRLVDVARELWSTKFDLSRGVACSQIGDFCPVSGRLLETPTRPPRQPRRFHSVDPIVGQDVAVDPDVAGPDFTKIRHGHNDPTCVVRDERVGRTRANLQFISREPKDCDGDFRAICTAELIASPERSKEAEHHRACGQEGRPVPSLRDPVCNVRWHAKESKWYEAGGVHE